MPWYYDPQSGGQKIPPRLHDTLRRQAEDFSRTRGWYGKSHLILRFKSQFCYIDEQHGDDKRVFPFIRLRYFRSPTRDTAIWSMACYTWSHERFEPCVFANGTWEGTLEEAIENCEEFLLSGL